jgi:O-antigen/teichoic acid export membrane protein
MPEDVDVVGSLRQVAGGAAVVVTGTLSGMLLQVGGRALFTRAYTPTEYGLFSLAFTVIAIVSVLASVGLRNGVTRQIAFYGADDGEDVRGVITWGLVVAVVAGTAVAAAMWVLAEPVAVRVFGKPEYELALRLAALGVPALGLVRVGTAVFRGFSRTRERVIFQELLQKGSFPLLLAAAVALGLDHGAALATYPLSLGLTAVAYAGYLVWANPASFRSNVRETLGRWSAGADLVRFSLPLMFASLLIRVMTWTDVIMLGYFRPPAVVGLYDAVRPLVRIVPVIWGSMIFMYTPLVSKFHADGDTAALRRVYFVVTKWFASATFPIILAFLLFPATVLGAVFGPAYTEATTALRLLAIAYFFGNVMGPNGATLTAIGRTRSVMWANLVAAALNIGLNVALIPPFGLTGAAVATAAALIVRNAVRVWWLYHAEDVHSLRGPMLRPMAVTTALVLGGYALAGRHVSSPAGVVVALGTVVAVYVGAMYLLGDVAHEDRDLLRTVVAGRLLR